MSGLYNLLNQVSPIAGPVLGWLNLDHKKIPRFRDAFLRDDGADGLRFVILTRAGGGNRSDYTEAIHAMQSHPDYLRDYDDSFDHTYAWFEYRISDPEVRQEIEEGLKEIREKDESMIWHVLRNCGMKEITDRNLEAIKNMPIPEAKT